VLVLVLVLVLLGALARADIDRPCELINKTARPPLDSVILFPFSIKLSKNMKLSSFPPSSLPYAWDGWDVSVSGTGTGLGTPRVTRGYMVQSTVSQ
jgi:hypothetical protein